MDLALLFTCINDAFVQILYMSKEEGGSSMSVLDNFGTWKEFLADKIEHAGDQGMSHDTISNMAFQVGDYLSKSVEAKNEEEAILRELWSAASEDEQRAIASSMVKLVQNQGS